jgi:hypothetical protein
MPLPPPQPQRNGVRLAPPAGPPLSQPYPGTPPTGVPYPLPVIPEAVPVPPEAIPVPPAAPPPPNVGQQLWRFLRTPPVLYLIVEGARYLRSTIKGENIPAVPTADPFRIRRRDPPAKGIGQSSDDIGGEVPMPPTDPPATDPIAPGPVGRVYPAGTPPQRPSRPDPRSAGRYFPPLPRSPNTVI